MNNGINKIPRNARSELFSEVTKNCNNYSSLTIGREETTPKNISF